MTLRLLAVFLLLIHSLGAIELFLPNGDIAKHIDVKVTLLLGVGENADSLESENFKTTNKGILSIPKILKKKMASPGSTIVLDVKGYALHVQCWHQLSKLTLLKDEGVDGVYLDDTGKPLVNKKLCMSRGIGLIWGQVYVPSHFNEVTTNEKGEFTMRQVVLNDAKLYGCSADIVASGTKYKLDGGLATGMTVMFSGPNYKKPKERVVVKSLLSC